MKPLTYALLAAAAACGMASAQTTAYTTPVGYITAAIAGNASANPSGAATYLSATLIQPAVFSGASVSSPSGGTSITFSGGVPLSLDSSYVLEISSGTQEGWWSPVASSTATSVTVADTFPSSLPANVTVTVRKFSTVKSVFGANSAGLTPFDGGENQADEIQFLNPSTGSVSSVVYLPESFSGEPDAWFDFVGGVNADNYVIVPGTSVRVIRYASSAASLVSSGEVKTTKTQMDVYPAENWLAQPMAAGGTLGQMNFFPQLIQFDGEAANDFLNVLLPSQSTNSYVALSAALDGGFMMDFVLGTDATSTVIPEGTGFLLVRDPSQSSSVLTIPGSTVVTP